MNFIFSEGFEPLEMNFWEANVNTILKFNRTEQQKYLGNYYS